MKTKHKGMVFKKETTKHCQNVSQLAHVMLISTRVCVCVMTSVKSPVIS